MYLLNQYSKNVIYRAIANVKNRNDSKKLQQSVVYIF